jgi:hypothetical protein
VNQQNHTTLIKIEGVNDKKDVEFYQGKRIAYVYRVRAGFYEFSGPASSFDCLTVAAFRLPRPTSLAPSAA